MYILEVYDYFSAAHQLNNYKGKCENLHGHNWKVLVQVKGSELNQTGYLIDFKDLKKYLAQTLDKYDHRNLNQIPPFTEKNPTAELIAQVIYHDLAKVLPPHTQMHAVKVWESENSCCEYKQSPD
jgi:6-pyruvoyltetrahydropterin/6-carboxytetrahydropterin synthase